MQHKQKTKPDKSTEASEWILSSQAKQSIQPTHSFRNIEIYDIQSIVPCWRRWAEVSAVWKIFSFGLKRIDQPCTSALPSYSVILFLFPTSSVIENWLWYIEFDAGYFEVRLTLPDSSSLDSLFQGSSSLNLFLRVCNFRWLKFEHGTLLLV